MKGKLNAWFNSHGSIDFFIEYGGKTYKVDSLTQVVE